MERVSRPDPLLVGIEPTEPGKHPNATDHYGLLWWNNADASMPGVPTDAYFAWGLYDSLIVVVPSLELVIARAGPNGFTTTSGSDYTELTPFLTPISEAVAVPEPPTAASWLASLLLLRALARRRWTRRRNE